jgi:hypothetical protein
LASAEPGDGVAAEAAAAGLVVESSANAVETTTDIELASSMNAVTYLPTMRAPFPTQSSAKLKFLCPQVP